ncbi:unnamed protein product [Callosobruchus maculatus]|uniref:MSP domain-containing protein n=1 Tax=Callosobruchus maculatus TaxID=64391 RepID=A0A653D2H3_CALMS|nr:unnamed protein product [Callosobruchus maculatus]
MRDSNATPQKMKQVLVIDPPNELKFRGPFNVSVTSYMKLTNPTEDRIMFKIKTTAPKMYCVRPNSGILEGKAVIEVAVCLQPFLFNPAEKNKHKFMVQSAFAPEGEINLETVWKEIDADRLMDSKLKCVFELPPDDQNKTTENTAEAIKPLRISTTDIANNIELTKAAQEMQQLKNEEAFLRKDNLQLKEELLQLRTQQRNTNMNRYQPPELDQGIPISLFVVAFVMIIVGIVLGKYAI